MKRNLFLILVIGLLVSSCATQKSSFMGTYQVDHESLLSLFPSKGSKDGKVAYWIMERFLDKIHLSYTFNKKNRGYVELSGALLNMLTSDKNIPIKDKRLEFSYELKADSTLSLSYKDKKESFQIQLQDVEPEWKSFRVDLMGKKIKFVKQ